MIDTAELLHYYHGAYRDAVAVLVSRSGESIETLKLLPLLKAQGTRIVGVTDVAGSTLAREADATVLIHGGKDQLVAVQSYTATLITLRLLGAALQGAFETARPELENAIRLLAGYVPRCVDLSAEWRPFFDGAPAIHLLGRGRALASIHEGALLFNEVAEVPRRAAGGCAVPARAGGDRRRAFSGDRVCAARSDARAEYRAGTRSHPAGRAGEIGRAGGSRWKLVGNARGDGIPRAAGRNHPGAVRGHAFSGMARLHAGRVPCGDAGNQRETGF